MLNIKPHEIPTPMFGMTADMKLRNITVVGH